MRSDHRQEAYEVWLCDLDGNALRRLDAERGGQVIDSADPSVGTSATLTVVLAEGDAIDWDSAMVRVWYRSAGGEWDRPLITGYPAVSRSTVDAESVSVSLDVYDTTEALRGYYVPRIFGVAAGTALLARARELIAEAAPLLTVSLPESEELLGQDLTWPAGTPWLSIVNALLQAAGIDTIYSDGWGALRADPLVPSAE